MKRRDAIRSIVIFSLGTGVLYSCTDPFQAMKNLHLKNLTFSKAHLKILDKLSKAILPIQLIPELQNHTALPFIMKQVNDLQTKESQQLFQRGYEIFQAYFTEKTNEHFLDANPLTVSSFLERLNTLEIASDETEGTAVYIHKLYQTLKQENLLYLKTTEHFQRQYRFYEMAPGRFDGNHLVAELDVHEE